MRVGFLDFLHLFLVAVGTVAGTAVNVPFGLWSTVKGTGAGFLLGPASGVSIHMVAGFVMLDAVGRDQARRQRVQEAWRRRLAAERGQRR